jgi:prepilin-type N-terminal cleavage/methylation domain-containing protein
MPSFTLRARLQPQSGFTLIEMLVSMVVMGLVMGGLANIFISGSRASSDGQARLTSQQNVTVALTRLEYDARCASTASLLNKSGSNGGGVHLSIPSQCTHSSGDVSWCVTSGSLVRYAATTCTGTGETFASSVTSATPFSCYTPTGAVDPQLVVALRVDSGGTSDATSATDYITMHNVAATSNAGGATALPATTITVGSTAVGFPTSGSLNTPNGVITYTGTTSTTFTGATGGTGTLAALAPVVWAGGCS